MSDATASTSMNPDAAGDTSMSPDAAADTQASPPGSEPFADLSAADQSLLEPIDEPTVDSSGDPIGEVDPAQANSDAAARFGPTGNPMAVQGDLGPGEATSNLYPPGQEPAPLSGPR